MGPSAISPTLEIIFRIAAIFGVLAGVVLGLFADHIQQRIFGPKLKLEFGGGGEFMTPMTDPSDTVVSLCVRVKVTNTSMRMAKNCRAYLVNVEKEIGRNRFDRTEYCDSIQLAWSCLGADDRFNGISIPKGVPQFFNVLSIDKEPEYGSCPLLIKVVPFRYRFLFEEAGTFRLTVHVAGDQVKLQSHQIIFTWEGTWDSFLVHNEGSRPSKPRRPMKFARKRPVT